MINQSEWYTKYEDLLIDSWEEGFHHTGDSINEACFDEFVKNAWISFNESQSQLAIDEYEYDNWD